jgi:hypothetical protein
MKRIGIILLSVICCFSVYATERVNPPSFKYSGEIVANPAMYHLDFKPDIQKLIAEDEENMKLAIPLRIAVGKDVTLNLNRENTTRSVLPSNEQIWQYAIRSDEAKGLIVTFDELYIPQGDTLFVYTKDRKQVTIFTNATNPSGGAFATDALLEDEIIFEYVSTTQTEEKQARINISNIAYIYKSLQEITDDVSCYINTNCPEGENWQLQKNGVIRLMIPSYGGWGYCSGSLINNVREDKTPYILTANHCVSGSNGQLFSSMKFEFFKESTSTNCFDQTEQSSLTKTMTGATLIATTPINGSSDGTLLKLTSYIPEDWEVYYNGWDAREIAATSGVSIHHPNAFVKKISTFLNPLVSDGNIYMGPGTYTGTNADWKVVWSSTGPGRHSVTYGGSSGSPIFNQDGLIVGTLTGGSSYCYALTAPDYYGKFSYHWDKNSNSQQHFKNYLDPDNTGTLVLQGYDPHGFVLEGEPEAIAATDITPVGFTAHWEALENAKKYYLDIYQKDENNDNEYLDGFERKDVGNVLSYTITDLNHETEYWYVVRAGYQSQITEASNEISVTTDPPTFEYFYPVATEATDINPQSFTANWEELPEATSYLLNVYQKSGGDDITDSVDFTDRKVPEGWTTNSIAFYSDEEFVGKSAAALRLNKNEYIESPEYPGAVKSIEFWYRGKDAGASGSLVVLGYANGEWKEIKRIKPLNNAVGGETITILSAYIQEVTTAIKITYEKASGYVSIDDISVIYERFSYTTFVADYDKYDVGNVNAHTINGLESESDYYYLVIGYNGSVYSHPSNEIAAKTGIVTAITNVEGKTLISVDSKNIHIQTDILTDKTNVLLYNIAGQLVASRPLQHDVLISRQGLPSGVYFIKTGGHTYKILLR